MAGTNIGIPSTPVAPGTPKPGVTCETIELPVECVNNTTANVVITKADLLAKAIAGATANGQTFSDGSAITGAAPQSCAPPQICALCANQPVKLDDGSTFVPTCDTLGVQVAPNGGTNCTALNCGGTAEVGPTDEITILPGAGFVGSVKVTQCKDKAGTVVPA